MEDTDLMASLAILAGLGTPSVQEQFQAVGLVDQYGRPIVGDPYSYSAGRPDLTSMPDGPSKSSRGNIGSKLKSAAKDTLGGALAFADDLVTPAAKRAQLSLLNRVGGIGAGGATGPLGAITRFAASPAALTAAKVGTGIGALGGVLGAADVLVGNDSLGNKAMDTVAMGIGGTLGAVGGPIGIAAGAGLGKAASDATQWLFGDKKSAEQRKMEEALALLRGGQI